MKSIVAYTHLLEFMPDRESKVSGAFMLLDGLVYVASPMVYLHVTKDLNFLFLIAATMNLLSMVLFAAMRVPESLKFLLSKNRFDDFWGGFQSVQRLNRLSES